MPALVSRSLLINGQAAGWFAGGVLRFANPICHLLRLVPMESAHAIVEPLRVEAPGAIVVADNSLRVAPAVSQLVITIGETDSIQFFSLTAPIPFGLPGFIPTRITILR